MPRVGRARASKGDRLAAYLRGWVLRGLGDFIAALGGDLEVPTLDGRLSLKIPPETQTGKVFRIRGKGVKPVRGGPTGDLVGRLEPGAAVDIVEHALPYDAEREELAEALDEASEYASFDFGAD